jgi:hypothetical protein
MDKVTAAVDILRSYWQSYRNSMYTVGIGFGVDVEWIRSAWLVTSSRTDMVTICTGLDALFRDRVLGAGVNGQIYSYASTTTNRRCALKCMTKTLTRGFIGNHTFLEAVVNSAGCPIVFTKFIKHADASGKTKLYQIMELGDGTADACAHYKVANPHEFLRFAIKSCATLIKHGLSNTDAKLTNIAYKQEDSVEFRLIDVDGIGTCALEHNLQAHAAKYNTEFPDSLFTRYNTCTYPIIRTGNIVCPILVLLQTWYSHLVAGLQYYATYIGNDELMRDIDDVLYWEYMRDYDFDTLGIFSVDHPFYYITHSPEYTVPAVFVTAAEDLLRFGSTSVTNLVTSCQAISNPTPGMTRNTEYLDAYEKYADTFNEIAAYITHKAHTFDDIIPPNYTRGPGYDFNDIMTENFMPSDADFVSNAPPLYRSRSAPRSVPDRRASTTIFSSDPQ